LREAGTKLSRQNMQKPRHPPAEEILHMSALEKWNPFRASSPWDPIRELEEMHNRLASLFGQRLPVLRNPGEEGFTVTTWSPTVDIAEDDKENIVKAELPGMNKEDVKVTVEGGLLLITGERKAEREEKNKKYHRIERSYGSFTRSFTLPEGAAGDKVSAEFKDGVLQVHLPKDEKAKAKSIEVKVQ